MNEEQVESQNRIAAQASILRAFVVELTRRQGFTADDINRLTAPVDILTPGANPNSLVILNDELLKFRQDLMSPIMGVD